MTPEELDEARALEAYREWLEEGCDGDDIDGHINDIVITTSFLMTQAYLAGARMGREQERERANHPIAFAVRVMAGAFKDLDSAKREAREALARITGRA